MYQLTSTTNILRLADGALIPADPDNSDYALYLAWLDLGNVPAPAEEEPETGQAGSTP